MHFGMMSQSSPYRISFDLHIVSLYNSLYCRNMQDMHKYYGCYKFYGSYKS